MPQRRLEGFRAFTTQRLPTEQSRSLELSARGQFPEVMVIGCCDSRVSPEVIFDVGPGELFVLRNIANLVPIYQPDANAHGVSAAQLIEFIKSWAEGEGRKDQEILGAAANPQPRWPWPATTDFHDRLADARRWRAHRASPPGPAADVGHNQTTRRA